MNVTRLHGATDPVQGLAEALSQESPLKLWSVIVSCLGDASHCGQAEVSGLVLSALVERIGLQPQAMRVALHRLKRDGWVDSRREGRVGFHRLTDMGLAQMRAVSGRIYGPPATASPWHLVGLPPDAPDGFALLPEALSAVPISRSFALVSGPIDHVPDDWLVTSRVQDGLPDWVRGTVAEAACEVEFAAFEAAVASIGALPDDAMDRFALRVLVLHGWRRLALRSNVAAEAVLGEARAEIACRAQVAAFLEALGPAKPDQVLS